MRELIIKPFDLKKIEWNADEIKAELDQELEQFRNPQKLDKKLAKETVAFLNKVSKAISDKAIAIDKDLSKPIKDFRTEVKEMNTMIDEVKKPYDEYLYATETKRKSEKEKLILDIYEYNIGEFRDFIPIERVWNDKWLNATYELEAIANDIKATVINAKETLAAYERMNLRFLLEAKRVYFNTLSMEEGVRANDELCRLAGQSDDGFPYTKKAEITASESQFDTLVDFCKTKDIEILWL